MGVKQQVDRIAQRAGYIPAGTAPEVAAAIRDLATEARAKAVAVRDARSGDALSALNLPQASRVDASDAYARHPILFAGVKRVADSAAQIPVQLGRMVDGEFQPIDDHPILDLLNRPNSEQTGDQFARALFSRHVLSGETLVLLDYGDAADPRSLASPPPPMAEPAEMLLMHPSRLCPIPDPTGIRVVGGYELKAKGNRYPVHRDRVLHPRDFNASPGATTGIGAGEALGTTLSADLNAEAFNDEGFRGGGSHKRLVVTWPDTMQNLTDAMRQFAQKYLMRGQSRKPIGIDNGAKLTEVGQSNSDLEFSGLRKMAREYIAAALGVPPSMIGILEYANYSNMEVQERILWELTIRPMLLLYQGYWQRFLLPKFRRSAGLVIRYDLSGVGVLQENLGDWVEVAKGVAMIPGAADVDQLREIVTMRSIAPLNRPPNPSRVVLPMSMATLEQVVAGTAGLGGFAIGSTSSMDDDASEPTRRAPRHPVVEAAIRDAWSHKVAVDNRRARGQLERKFIGEVVRPVLREWEAILRSQLEARKGAKVYTVAEIDAMLRVVLTRDEQQKITEAAARRFHTRAVDLRAKWVLQQLSDAGSTTDQLDMTLPWVQRFLQEKPLTFAGEWRGTVLERLRERLTEVLADETEAVSANALQAVVSDAMAIERGPRALMIARTESTAAYEFGTHSAYVVSDVVGARRWLPNTSRHEGVRGFDGERDVPLGAPFSVNGHAMMHPGDPAGPVGEIVNCGCSTMPVVDPVGGI